MKASTTSSGMRRNWKRSSNISDRIRLRGGSRNIRVAKESPQNNLYFLTAGNRVVPLWMEAVWPQFQTLHVVVGDRQSGLIQPRIELGAKPQPSLGRGRTDEIDYGFVANQRLAFPVHADEREHAVLDLVPLASSRGVMAYGDAQALVVGQLL